MLGQSGLRSVVAAVEAAHVLDHAEDPISRVGARRIVLLSQRELTRASDELGQVQRLLDSHWSVDLAAAAVASELEALEVDDQQLRELVEVSKSAEPTAACSNSCSSSRDRRSRLRCALV